MGELYDIAQRHMDAYGVTGASLARRMGIPQQTLNAWKNRGLRRLPERKHLEALAREAGASYGEVLQAALRDAGYLPKEREGSGRQPAPMSEPQVLRGPLIVDSGESPTPEQLRRAASQQEPPEIPGQRRR